MLCGMSTKNNKPMNTRKNKLKNSENFSLGDLDAAHYEEYVQLCNHPEYVSILKVIDKYQLLLHFIEAKTGISEREIRLAVENYHPF